MAKCLRTGKAVRWAVLLDQPAVAVKAVGVAHTMLSAVITRDSASVDTCFVYIK
jgi:hypothetical protein